MQHSPIESDLKFLEIELQSSALCDKCIDKLSAIFLH